MCLILFALRAHRDYPLIVAANRDEYFARPTAPMDFWSDHPQLLAGRDLQAGGTWLGVNRQGRFAAVTNVRNGRLPADRPGSRGALVADYLLDRYRLAPGPIPVPGGAAHYNGFNLLAGSPEQLFYCSNRHPEARVKELPAGIYGLSNGLLDTPWPKVEHSKEALQQCLQRDWGQLAEREQELLQILADERQAEDHLLPDTGVEREWEKRLSARFIVSEDYGTRASTLVLFHRSGNIRVLEAGFEHRRPMAVRRFSLDRSTG